MVFSYTNTGESGHYVLIRRENVLPEVIIFGYIYYG